MIAVASQSAGLPAMRGCVNIARTMGGRAVAVQKTLGWRQASAVLLTLTAGISLGACTKSTTSGTDANGQDSAASSHMWTYREGQEYGYVSNLSDDQKKAGVAAAPVLMFRYIGETNGVYTVEDATDDSSLQASCAKPCSVVKVVAGGSVERLTFNPESVIGAALTDAFNGQMEIYGSGSAGPEDGGGSSAPAAAVAAAEAAEAASQPAPTPQPTPAVAPDIPPPFAQPSVAPPPPALKGAMRYACAFDPASSLNPPRGVGGISFVVDEARACINNRTAYARAANGVLARAMLSDKDQRVSVVSISSGRESFTRRDYLLDTGSYAAARAAAEDLITIACPASPDPEEMSRVQSRILAAHRSLRGLLAGQKLARRITWRCASAATAVG